MVVEPVFLELLLLVSKILLCLKLRALERVALLLRDLYTRDFALTGLVHLFKAVSIKKKEEMRKKTLVKLVRNNMRREDGEVKVDKAKLGMIRTRMGPGQWAGRRG